MEGNAGPPGPSGDPRGRHRRRRDEDRRRPRRRGHRLGPGARPGADEARARRARTCWRTAPRWRRSSVTGALPVGIGLCELVDLDGRPPAPTRSTGATSISAVAIEAPRVVLESDCGRRRSRRRRFGAGVGRLPFLFAIVGTGASVCLVVDGPPVRRCAWARRSRSARRPSSASPAAAALARAAGVERAEDVILDPAHAALVDAPPRRWARCSPCSRTRSTPR